jgi:hypothetical protein
MLRMRTDTRTAAPHTTFIYHCARAATWLVHACTAASCTRQVVNRLKKESVFETIRDYGVNYDKVDSKHEIHCTQRSASSCLGPFKGYV